MPYESDKPSRASLFIPLLIAVVTIALGLYFFVFKSSAGESVQKPTLSHQLEKENGVNDSNTSPAITPDSPALEAVDTVADEAVSADSPKVLMELLKAAISQGTVQQFLDKVDLGELEEVQKQEIVDFANQNPDIELRPVGVLEFDKSARWALETPDGQVMYFDVEKSIDNQWGIAKVYSMQNGVDLESTSDALSTADTFVKTLLDHNFEEALKFTNPSTISNAQIAGLCIMFEEGDYILNPDKPLNSLFQREGIAAFTVNLLDPSTEQKAQIEIALEKDKTGSPWKVSELNIEKLLKSYISQVSGGDAYYTPMIKNPQGGDRLALYFEFNEGQLSTRAKRQLDIIAALLKTNISKRLTLSGHADAIGSDGYNTSLSLARAESVREYLIFKGLLPMQIKLSAYGESMPRGDNETDEGRRANRRTEIYLDF